MGIVNVTLGEDTQLNLLLGRQMENAVTEVVFDFSAWNTTYGSGTLALSVQRPGDTQPYAVVLSVSGTNATWSISSLDTAYKGIGEIQLTYTVGTAIKKSVIYKFTVYQSLGENGEYPSPGQTWQEEIEDELADVKSDLSEYENIFTGDVDESVQNWLDAHPEATTTVQDKAITRDKLALNISDYLPLDYHETVFEKDGGKTTVWYSIIPSDYKPVLCLANDTINMVENPVDNAYNNRSTISVNAGLFYTTDSKTKGYLLKDGQVLNNINYDDGTNLDYLYMEEDGTLNSIGPSTGMSVGDLEQLNPKWAILGFYTLVKNGVYVATGRADDALNPPRTFIGQDSNGKYIVGVSSGRNEGEKGLSMIDIYNFCVNNASFNPYFLYNLDGGGSSTFIYKGTRINTLTQGENRNCANFISWIKDDTRILNSFETSNAIGNELIQLQKYLYENVDLMTRIPAYIKGISSAGYSNCNNVIYTSIYLCSAGITNWPINDYGFLITLRQDGNLVNQIAIDKSHLYIREIYLGATPPTISKWREVYALPSYDNATSGTGVSVDSVKYAKSGNVVIVKGDSYMSASITANSIIATGLPRGLISEQNGVIFKSGNMYRLKITGDGELVNLDELPSGYYKISLTYFSE